MRIVIIGAGGVAESLIYSLAQAGVPPVAIVSPTVGHAEELASRYAPRAKAYHSLVALPTDADCYIIAVSDASIARVAATMPSTNGVWLHTSACTPLEQLLQYNPRSGVFYPLNTFTKGRPLSWRNLPLFEESTTPEVAAVIASLSSLLGCTCYWGDLTLRRQLHLAAVFACNYVNHQWTIAAQLLQHYQLPVSLLHPLITETYQKALAMSPYQAQTGPARRGDKPTIAMHRSLLQDFSPEIQALYEANAQSISYLYHPESELS